MRKTNIEDEDHWMEKSRRQENDRRRGAGPLQATTITEKEKGSGFAKSQKPNGIGNWNVRIKG